jgi:hypothetical protein
MTGESSKNNIHNVGVSYLLLKVKKFLFYFIGTIGRGQLQNYERGFISPFFMVN